MEMGMGDMPEGQLLMTAYSMECSISLVSDEDLPSCGDRWMQFRSGVPVV